jgi:hypothetical protein
MVVVSGETIALRQKPDRVTKQHKREPSTWPTPVNKREVWPVLASVATGIALAILLVWLFI